MKKVENISKDAIDLYNGTNFFYRTCSKKLELVHFKAKYYIRNATLILVLLF